MSEPLQPHSTVPLTEQLVAKITDEHKRWLVESQKSDTEFDTSNEIQYYVVSTKFINEWSAMVRQAEKAEPLAGRVIKLPGLINEQLIENSLKDFGECELKRTIQQGIDYKFYTLQAAKVFQNYPGSKIPRRAYLSGAEKKIQLYPLKFKFVYVSRTLLMALHEDNSLELPAHQSMAYKNQTILDMQYRLIQYSKKDERNRLTKYRNNSFAKIYLGLSFDPNSYAAKYKAEKLSQTMMLEPPGTLVASHKQIGDLEIPNQQFMLIVELKQFRWVYNEASDYMDKDTQRCEYCRNYRKTPVVCRCKKVEYCSLSCKDKDYKWHARECGALDEEDNLQPTFEMKQKSRNGLVGLSNLGNTCYMNSALQCMIHTRGLTDYFRQKNYLVEINQANPIGSKGKLVKAYGRFIQSVIVSEQEVVAPSRLKYRIGETKQMFSGFEQHDSQQFLLFILDTLHEDLNRVKQKPYTDGVENEGRPDHVVAKQSWITYLKRNQSIINDLMGGQYRSEVKCPDCENISVTFDPYLIFAVPIPSNQMKSINLYYFFSNYKSQTLKMCLKSKNNLVQQLREDVANKTNTPVEQILFIISGFNGRVRKVEDTETVDRLVNQKQLNEKSQERQLFAMQFEKQELEDLENKKFMIFKITHQRNAVTFKRPIPLDPKKLKGIDLYTRISQFTFNLWHRLDKPTAVERDTKFKVYLTKILEEKMFTIYLSHGQPKQVKNSLVFENRIEITPETEVSQLLKTIEGEIEFQVEYKQKPILLNFNSYKSHNTNEFASYHESDQSIKSGSDENYTLDECLQEMKKSEKLLEGNEVFCSKCQDLKLAEKKMQLYKASKYLIIQLRRFKQVGYQKSKNYANVNFPLDIDMAPYILSPEVPENYFIGDEESFIKPAYWKGYDQSASTKYQLYGVVNHHGGLSGGHYTACCRHEGRWYKLDDSTVTEIEADNVVSSAAYLLFYQRVD